MLLDRAAKPNAVFCPILLHKKPLTKISINIFLMEVGEYILVSYSLRKEAALKCVGTTADTFVTLARWQQGEQAVVEVGFDF